MLLSIIQIGKDNINIPVKEASKHNEKQKNLNGLSLNSKTISMIYFFSVYNFSVLNSISFHIKYKVDVRY